MNIDSRKTESETGKKVAIISLTTLAGAITSAGIILSIYSLINNVSFNVMNNPIHGLIFGVVITYLGMGYLKKKKKLKTELAKPTSHFSF